MWNIKKKFLKKKQFLNLNKGNLPYKLYTIYYIYINFHIQVNTQTMSTDSKKLPTIKMLLFLFFEYTKNWIYTNLVLKPILIKKKEKKIQKTYLN